MNKVEAIRKLNDEELRLGIAGSRASWHQEYANCPFVYAGGLPTAFTEGDLLAIFEQYGTVVHVNLVRDAETGKSRGFAFLQYHDPRSAALAVDNFTGVEIVPGRTLRVDHARDYSIPEEGRSTALDTTPPELKGNHNTRTTIAVREEGNELQEPPGAPSAEALREKAVLKRLRAMRKHRAQEESLVTRDESDGIAFPTKEEKLGGVQDEIGKDPGEFADGSRGSNGVPSAAARIEKQKRKQEKEQRKAERAKIREERKRRRAEREKAS